MQLNTELLYDTTRYSIVIQVVCLLLTIHATTFKLPQKLIDILKFEAVVETIELAWYIWFINSFNAEKMAQSRYLDWFITTPTMLIVFSAYFTFLKQNEDSNDVAKEVSFYDFVQSDQKILTAMIMFNVLMLYTGILVESTGADRLTFCIIGFVFFVCAFYLLWKHYAQHTTESRKIFYFTTVIWSLYGLAFMLPEIQKNLAYNALDLLAKNFFAVYLYYRTFQFKN